MTTYTSEPGSRLGGRYRLEDRIAAGSGWDAWKAIDETLARAVTVFTFVPGFPRIADVVTAARAASRLTEPRLAQVFDVDEDSERAYVVMEWAAGETLGDMLSHGHLEPRRAAQIIAEAAAALATAHAAGLAHLCLSPGSVRWSPTGEVKVVGLGIDAALSGTTADDPVLTDTLGLGRLLYAALTGYWPGPEYPPLPAAPMADGQPRSPRQVVAGLPSALSDLTCRAMQFKTRDASAALTTPEELARALLVAMPAGPVLPEPGAAWLPEGDYAPADWHTTDGYATDGYGWAEAGRAGGPLEAAGYPVGPAWDDRDARATGGWIAGADGGFPGSRGPGRESGGRGRRGPGRGRPPGSRAGLSTVAIIVAGVLVLAAVAAFTLWPRSSGPTRGASGGRTRTVQHNPAVTTLVPVGASGFDALNPADRSDEQSKLAPLAIDGNLSTAWDSQWYRSAKFGGLKSGTGLIIDMGKPVRATTVTVMFGTQPGTDVRLLVGNSNARTAANVRSMTPVASANNAVGRVVFTITKPVPGRYLVLWFTNLPVKPGSHGAWYMAQVFNVAIRGYA